MNNGIRINLKNNANDKNNEILKIPTCTYLPYSKELACTVRPR